MAVGDQLVERFVPAEGLEGKVWCRRGCLFRGSIIGLFGLFGVERVEEAGEELVGEDAAGEEDHGEAG